MRTIARVRHHVVLPAVRDAPAALRRLAGMEFWRARVKLATARVSRVARPWSRAVYREHALPYGSAGSRLRRGTVLMAVRDPAAGDWLSGRAPRSHRGGHWFDPSIAHPAQRPVAIL